MCYLCILNHFLNWIWCRHQNGTPRLWPIYIYSNQVDCMWRWVLPPGPWAAGRQEGSVYCTDVPSGVNGKWRKWLKWQCWGDRKGHTALIQARFWPSAPARCFKEPPPLSVCWDRTQLSASLHQRRQNTVLYIRAQMSRQSRTSQDSGSALLRSLYSCYTSRRNQTELNFLFSSFSRCFCCSGLHMTNPCNSIWRVSCNLWRLFLRGCVKLDDGPQSSFCSFKVLEKKECWRREVSHPWRTTNSADSSWPRSTATFKWGEEIIITSFVENHTYKKLLSFTVMLFLFLSNPG